MADMLLFWTVITNMGGVSVMLVSALVIAVCLLTAGAMRLSLLWCVLFGSGLALVVVTKVAYIGWGIGSAHWDFTGLSGHAMRAAAVMPVLAFFMLGRQPLRYRHLGALAGAMLAALVAYSRLALDSHSMSETVSGYLLGLALAVLMLRMAQRQADFANARALAVVCIVLLTPLPMPPGEAAMAQHAMTKVALALSGRDKPFERGTWRHDGASHTAHPGVAMEPSETGPASAAAPNPP